MRVRFGLPLLSLVSALAIGGAAAQPPLAQFDAYADPEKVVLAVNAGVKAVGGAVRLTIFDSEANFLETPSSKHQATVDENGVAVIALSLIESGDYAFAAYYDRNGDGKLNRNFVGAPKEPIAFSNGFKPKLRKPTFAETKVDVAPGSLVVISLDV